MSKSDIYSSIETSPHTGLRFARNLDWNLLRTFYEIVNAGGVSEAARQLNRGQPAISMALKRLEENLETTLCSRGPSGFSLTSDGELLSEKCNKMFSLASSIPNAMADASTEVRGRLRLQLISNLVDDRIDIAIKKFHSTYPNVEVFVSIATWDVIQRSVVRNEVEIGIAPVTLRTNGLKYVELYEETYRPYCGQPHPLFGQTVHNPSDLAEYAFVLTGADEPESQTRFRQRNGLGKHIAGISEHLEEARRLTVLGIGLCFLPEAFAEKDVNLGKLHAVLETGNDPVSSIFVISNPKAPHHHPRDKMLKLLTKFDF